MKTGKLLWLYLKSLVDLLSQMHHLSRVILKLNIPSLYKLASVSELALEVNLKSNLLKGVLLTPGFVYVPS